MPELPEVESARRVLVHALDREIASVDDADTAHRQGKTMWCATRGRDGGTGPHLGVHRGMGGRVVERRGCSTSRCSREWATCSTWWCSAEQR